MAQFEAADPGLLHEAHRHAHRVAGPDRATATAERPDHGAVLRLQRDAGNAAVSELLGEQDPHGIDRVLQSGGSSLDNATRVQMEPALGADFSDVRIHTGRAADESAASLGAKAYTMGNDIVFAEGAYDPASTAGQTTLAHELTHVVQQRSGPVDGTMTDTGVSLSDPSDRFEREAVATAEQVVTGGGVAHGPAGPASAAGPVAQRHEDEEGAVQMLASDTRPLQREEIEEEEMPAQTLRADGSLQREPEEEELTAL